MKTLPIAGVPSWRFSSDLVSAAVTVHGGHLAPVTFRLGRRTIEPLSIAPWAGETLAADTPMILKVLRGDFFCAPFGGNDSPYRGERHPVHGESANNKWQFRSCKQESGETRLHLSLPTRIRTGSVEKRLLLKDGHTAVYSRHVLSGMTGKMSYGQHAMLKFPDTPGSGHISTSRLRYAQVAPVLFEDPANKGYSSLQTGASIRSLKRVPSACGGTTDITRYPDRRGFEDLLQAAHAAAEDFAWTAVAFPDQGYLWYSLKDPRVLPSTVFWISNGGRHYPPWSGRHTNVMGIEDVMSWFHYGLAESAKKNSFSDQGIPTCVTLNPKRPHVVNSIMGVVAIPPDFDEVASIRRTPQGLAIRSTDGTVVEARVDTSFLQSA